MLHAGRLPLDSIQVGNFSGGLLSAIVFDRKVIAHMGAIPRSWVGAGSVGQTRRRARSSLGSVGEQLGERGGREHALRPDLDLLDGGRRDALLDVRVRLSAEAPTHLA